MSKWIARGLANLESTFQKFLVGTLGVRMDHSRNLFDHPTLEPSEALVAADFGSGHAQSLRIHD
jgi:hypothetical protein